jgi:eukaryotic-like serine/threonine-protein kinase
MISRLSLVFLAVIAGCAAPRPALPPAVRFVMAIPQDRAAATFAVSSDGRWLAYSAESPFDRRRRIYIRPIVDTPANDRELPGTVGGTNPFFSPDGTAIAYFSRGALWHVPANGSAAPFRIADAPDDAAGGTWTDGGRIVFAPLGNLGLVAVAAAGGTPAALTNLITRDGELEHGWPQAMPGGAIVFTVSQRGRDSHLEVLSGTGQRTRLRVPVVGQSRFVSPGHLVYGYLGNLMAVKFDVDELKIVGAPATIAKNLHTRSTYGSLGYSGFTVSPTGTLVWLRASIDDARSRLVRVDRDGSYTSLTGAAEVYQTPRLSPDGGRLAIVVRSGIMTREIRVLDAARPDRILFVVRGGDNQSPAWMDNRRLTFGSNRDGLQKMYVMTMGRAPTALFNADVAAARNPADWLRPPRLLAFYEIDPIRRRDVLLYRAGEFVVPVAATNANERSPALSPDGKWIAYVSDASGRDEIYLKPLDGSMEALQLTSSGAVEPRWTREGLFFRQGDRMLIVELSAGAPGALRELFEGDFEHDPGANLAAYDVDRRGSFIMLKSAVNSREWRVVQNWGTELGWNLP